jgi:hypothetical protein
VNGGGCPDATGGQFVVSGGVLVIGQAAVTVHGFSCATLSGFVKQNPYICLVAQKVII